MLRAIVALMIAVLLSSSPRNDVQQRMWDDLWFWNIILVLVQLIHYKDCSTLRQR
jgi:hypothetical protein